MDKECLKGVVYINRLLDLYSNNNSIDSVSAQITDKEFSLGVEYMIENNLLNPYELTFLSSYSDICKDALVESCKSVTDEEILCLDNRESVLDEISLIKQLSSTNDDFNDKLFELFKDKIVTKSRRDVEYDKNTLQIIPYMIIEHDGDLVLLKKKKGDPRLIDTIDLPAGHCAEGNILDSMMSELKEELDIDPSDVHRVTYLDFIPPTNNKFSISYYHIGVLIMVNLTDGVTISNAEKDKHDIVYLKDVIKNPKYVEAIGDWASYGILQYLDYKNSIIKYNNKYIL